MQASLRHPVTLMYHGIILEPADIPPGREAGAELYDVAQDDFRRQMDWIRERGMFVSTLNERTDMEGRHPVILTFDDGMLNNFTRAWPVLREFHFPAYFFVTVGRIGRAGYMTWEHLKELQDNGMIIGSHGMSHRLLIERPADEIDQELRESRRMLQENLNRQVETLSIPRGFADHAVIKKARETGYRYIFTSGGRFRDEACIGRVAVKSSWTPSRFSRAVDGRTPLAEKAAGFIKETAVALLGPGGYDRWRTRILGERNDR